MTLSQLSPSYCFAETCTGTPVLGNGELPGFSYKVWLLETCLQGVAMLRAAVEVCLGPAVPRLMLELGRQFQSSWEPLSFLPMLHYIGVGALGSPQLAKALSVTPVHLFFSRDMRPGRARRCDPGHAGTSTNALR